MQNISMSMASYQIKSLCETIVLTSSLDIKYIIIISANITNANLVLAHYLFINTSDFEKFQFITQYHS